MKAVFLDFATLQPSDLSLSKLESLPVTLARYEQTLPSETAARLAGATIAITNKVVIDEAVMNAVPSLKLIAVTATGTNNIDKVAAAKRGITVANVEGYGTSAVSQHAFALLLALTNKIAAYHGDAVNGRWSQSPQFCLMDYPVMGLEGRTLGLIGFGVLGQAVAKLADAFGMRVLVAEGRAGKQAGRTPLHTVLAESDVISLHNLLTAETEKMVNAEFLSQMKRGAILINTARGGLIDEVALVEALRSGQLGGAGLDVLSVEPPPKDHILLAPDIPNLIITPHCAWVSASARQRLLDLTVDNIQHFLVKNTQ